jgi:hypothetical protein
VLITDDCASRQLTRSREDCGGCGQLASVMREKPLRFGDGPAPEGVLRSRTTPFTIE